MKTLSERKPAEKHLDAKALPATMRKREFHAQKHHVVFGPSRHKTLRPQKTAEPK